jgi:23S rRNA pseudouridine1911/1915/1917 synthase
METIPGSSIEGRPVLRPLDGRHRHHLPGFGSIRFFSVSTAGREALPDPDLSCTFRGEPQRLDLYLSLQSQDHSRSQFKKLIQEGSVLVNGVSVKVSYELRYGDKVSVWLPAPGSGERLTPENMPLEVLYEDEDIIVVNKAPGVVVHPGAGHENGTLVHGLLAHCAHLAMQGGPLRPGIVHRLDQGTSGALVAAKSERAYLNLIQQFKDHTVQKEYLALVYGQVLPVEGEIRTQLDRHPVDRKKMAVSRIKGREAISRWKVEKAWEELTLVRVAIETGRTHQIRVHFSHMGHPIVGDETYGGGRRRARSVKCQSVQSILLNVERQMLHARRLAFHHPVTQAALCFDAPIPSDFSQLLAQLA